MTEVWRDISGYTGVYQVSNLGRVRSLDRYEKCGTFIRKRKGKVLHQSVNRGGYLQLSLLKDGISHTKEVHRLVAQAFLPNTDNLPEVNHIDCDKTNNSVDNLEWVTREENTAHALFHGLKPKGDNHKSSKLTRKQVDWIRSHYIPNDINLGAKALAEKFSVSISTIYRIMSNNAWKG